MGVSWWTTSDVLLCLSGADACLRLQSKLWTWHQKKHGHPRWDCCQDLQAIAICDRPESPAQDHQVFKPTKTAQQLSSGTGLAPVSTLLALFGFLLCTFCSYV